MTGDRWTFLVVRGEDSPVRQYSLSSRVLRWAIGGSAVVALVLVGAAFAVGFDGYAAQGP